MFGALKGRTAGEYGAILITSKLIEESFIFSQMSIWNEHENGDKYHWLTFIEFQEMLCRIAHVAVNSGEGVAQQVYALVE